MIVTNAAVTRELRIHHAKPDEIAVQQRQESLPAVIDLVQIQFAIERGVGIARIVTVEQTRSQKQNIGLRQ